MMGLVVVVVLVVAGEEVEVAHGAVVALSAEMLVTVAVSEMRRRLVPHRPISLSLQTVRICHPLPLVILFQR